MLSADWCRFATSANCSWRDRVKCPPQGCFRCGRSEAPVALVIRVVSARLCVYDHHLAKWLSALRCAHALCVCATKPLASAHPAPHFHDPRSGPMTMRRLYRQTLAGSIAAVALTFSGQLSAQVSISEDLGTLYTTQGLLAGTLSAPGLQVTGYTSGGVFTQTWGDGGVDGIVNSFFNLSRPFSTFELRITSGTLFRLVLSGIAGGQVFDRDVGTSLGDEGTPGSVLGTDFSTFGTHAWPFDVVYRHAVAIGTNAPVGDLFAEVDIRILEGPTGLGLPDGGVASFFLTNNIAVTPLVSQTGSESGVVPEPVTMLLLGTGLMGIGAVARGRRQMMHGTERV